MLRETKQACIWVVVVPTINKFVTFANMTEGAVVAVPLYISFVSMHFSLLFLSSENGTVLTARGVSRCCKTFAA